MKAFPKPSKLTKLVWDYGTVSYSLRDKHYARRNRIFSSVEFWGRGCWNKLDKLDKNIANTFTSYENN